MNTTVRNLALATVFALSATACKKQVEPAAAPEAAPAAEKTAPPVSIAYGPATFSGSRATGNMGKLNVPVVLTNNSTSGLLLDVIGLSVFAPDGTKVCAAKNTFTNKASQGNSIDVALEVECEYARFPGSGPLPVKGTIIYRIGGDRIELPVDETVSFKR